MVLAGKEPGEREEINIMLSTRPFDSTAVREPNAPSWWHGDEAALAEANRFKSWVANHG